ncbi:DUF732 domain-containing protein [Nocardia alni]|uniref:DUF732 domain-containing protein n=1 Tax=Nocardia alni TaxID=2815723 RepID=UPI001C22A93C|nr:DUF732 domain-containing protein [Nocardia alni]
MLRTRGTATGVARRGAAASVAVAAASVLLLSACGHNDSTASSTPTLATSTTTAAPSTTAPASTTAAATTTAAHSTSNRAAPAAPPPNEQPVQVTPTPEQIQLTAKDHAFLDNLKQRGITVSDPQTALAAAAYVCQAQAGHVSPQEIQTYVDAMAGQDPAYDQQKMPIDQLGQNYIDASTQFFCPK